MGDFKVRSMSFCSIRWEATSSDLASLGKNEYSIGGKDHFGRKEKTVLSSQADRLTSFPRGIRIMAI